MRVADRTWAIGDVTGIGLMTHVGKCQGRVAATNIPSKAQEANYEAVPRVAFTDPQAAAVGAVQETFSATTPRGCRQDGDLYARLRPGERFHDSAQRWPATDRAYALGPDAGEWLQQATLAIRAHTPAT